jgi:anti-anti-sigma factor
MSLNISVKKKRDYVFTVDLEGSIDANTHDQLEKELKELVEDECTKAVILNMNGVTYVSSIGIRVIITAKRDLKAVGANFSMVNLQPQIKKVFDMMKILPMFDIFDDMPEADKYIDQMIKEELLRQ